MRTPAGARAFPSVAGAVAFLTIPAMLFAGLLLLALVIPFSLVSTATTLALLPLAVALPLLCTYAPARAWIAWREDRFSTAWLWLLAPFLCLGAIAVLLASNGV